jgi:hypothetical protein
MKSVFIILTIFILDISILKASLIDKFIDGLVYGSSGDDCIFCGSTSRNQSMSDELTKLITKTQIDILGLPEMKDYKVSNCSEQTASIYKYSICSDNTVSYVQAPSEGNWKQEGFCGQVTLQNIFHTMCGYTSNSEFANYYLNDYSIGVSSSTLVKGLNNLFKDYSDDCPSGRYEKYSAQNESDYISDIVSSLHLTAGSNQRTRINSRGQFVKRSPVITFIRIPGEPELHWITIMDVEYNNGNCEMIINQWDDQYKVPCKKVAKWSRNVSELYGDIFPSYTSIRFLNEN